MDFGPFKAGIDNTSPVTEINPAACRDAVGVLFSKAGTASGAPAGVLLASGRFDDAWTDDNHVYLSRDYNLFTLVANQPQQVGTFTSRPRWVLQTGDTTTVVTETGVCSLNGAPLSHDPVAFSGVEITTGSLPAGTYVYTVAEIYNGVEQPCTAQYISLEEGEGLRFYAPPVPCRVFVSEPNATTLMHLGDYAASATINYTSVVRGGHQPVALNMAAMPGGTVAAWHRGRLWVAKGSDLYSSEPWRYGMTDPATEFIQFPGQIVCVASTPSGLLVGCQRLYMLGDDERIVQLSETQVVGRNALVSDSDSGFAIVLLQSGPAYVNASGVAKVATGKWFTPRFCSAGILASYKYGAFDGFICNQVDTWAAPGTTNLDLEI